MARSETAWSAPELSAAVSGSSSRRACAALPPVAAALPRVRRPWFAGFVPRDRVQPAPETPRRPFSELGELAGHRDEDFLRHILDVLGRDHPVPPAPPAHQGRVQEFQPLPSERIAPLGLVEQRGARGVRRV
jgi:hypothetical protein